MVGNESNLPVWSHWQGQDGYMQMQKQKNITRSVLSYLLVPNMRQWTRTRLNLPYKKLKSLVPKPKIIVFAAFQFDPEAARQIEETKWPGVTLIKAQMNADLLTEDLKKKKASNESFWMVGQPDVTLEKIKTGDDKGKYVVEVHGFDYYDTRTQLVESGSVDKIAMWMLDTDYDQRSIFPRQVFFPMAGEKDGWAKLAKNLKAEIDDERIEQFKGVRSLPFARGPNGRIADKNRR